MKLCPHPEGLCVVSLDDGEFHVPRGDYDRLKTEWMKGAAFLTWTGFFGNVTTVKSAKVISVTDWTAEAWASYVADIEAREQEAKLA